ncbi:hypothetical protein [Candidatus Nitrososphaera sp. FF02]|uniref:hypothetical protein n=1 Tax=Candidatus Nitrososphaera sp. FF02 TaxID=3398226 RepID=UPI0039EABC57
MFRDKTIKIEFYIPAKTKTGQDIDPTKIDAIIGQIWPKYRGGTKLAGTGYYRKQSGENEVADSHVLAIVTAYDQSLEADIGAFKEKIRTELNQEDVLITWHFIEVF